VTTVLDEAKCSEVLHGRTSHINLPRWEECHMLYWNMQATRTLVSGFVHN